jgi:hypothetical protein
MSEVTVEPLDIRAVLTKIGRDLAESGKLREEANNLASEQRTLFAEAARLNRNRWRAPAIAIAGFAPALLQQSPRS